VPLVGRRAAGKMSVWLMHKCMQFTAFLYNGRGLAAGTLTKRQFQIGAKSVRVL
jgi:hypothetical protein